MSQLIPFDETVAEELNGRFSQTMFRSTVDFINFYNSGLINKSADEVNDFAGEVDNTFKNVKLQGKTLVFISKAEVELNEALRELKKWEIIIKVKDRLSALVDEGSLKNDTLVEFSSNNTGVLYSLADGEHDELNTQKVTEEKFFKPADEELVVEIHGEISNAESGKLHFFVSDFTSLDDQFITEIHSILFSR